VLIRLHSFSPPAKHPMMGPATGERCHRYDRWAAGRRLRGWTSTDLERCAARVGSVLDRAGAGPWIAVAHSFGVLALVRHLALVPDSPLRAVLLVAPADPDKVGLGALLPQHALRIPSACSAPNGTGPIRSPRSRPAHKHRRFDSFPARWRLPSIRPVQQRPRGILVCLARFRCASSAPPP
jgi:pimeloyl-ACP methyl ester carboxylesterase